MLLGAGQVGLTFVLLFCLYMVFAMLDYQGGIVSFLGITLVAPLFAALFSGISVIVFFIIGLPIRFNKKLNLWWRRHPYVAILLISVGLGLLILSLLPGFTKEVVYNAEGEMYSSVVPNLVLSSIGLPFTAIGTLHLYPPKFNLL